MVIKNSSYALFFNPPLSVWTSDETLFLVFDILVILLSLLAISGINHRFSLGEYVSDISQFVLKGLSTDSPTSRWNISMLTHHYTWFNKELKNFQPLLRHVRYHNLCQFLWNINIWCQNFNQDRLYCLHGLSSPILNLIVLCPPDLNSGFYPLCKSDWVVTLDLAFVNFYSICSLDNGVMKLPKRWEIISLVFTCLCFTKSFRLHTKNEPIDTVYDLCKINGKLTIFTWSEMFHLSVQIHSLAPHTALSFPITEWHKNCPGAYLLPTSQKLCFSEKKLHINIPPRWWDILKRIHLTNTFHKLWV